jgi:hypothetical protein
MLNWSESTIKKIRQIIKNMLSWAGILNKGKLERIILWVQLRDYLAQNEAKDFLLSIWI